MSYAPEQQSLPPTGERFCGKCDHRRWRPGNPHHCAKGPFSRPDPVTGKRLPMPEAMCSVKNADLDCQDFVQAESLVQRARKLIKKVVP